MGCLGSPLQQVTPGDQAAVADPGDGIQSHCCLMRQQRGIGNRFCQVVPQLRQGEELQPFAGSCHRKGLGQGVKEHLQPHHQRSNPAGLRGDEPGGSQQAQTGGRQQTAAQVIENLPAAQ